MLIPQVNLGSPQQEITISYWVDNNFYTAGYSLDSGHGKISPGYFMGAQILFFASRIDLPLLGKYQEKINFSSPINANAVRVTRLDNQASIVIPALDSVRNRFHLVRQGDDFFFPPKEGKVIQVLLSAE